MLQFFKKDSTLVRGYRKKGNHFNTRSSIICTTQKPHSSILILFLSDLNGTLNSTRRYLNLFPSFSRRIFSSFFFCSVLLHRAYVEY